MSRVNTLLQSALAQGLARIDAQMLMLHACERDTHDRAWLIMHSEYQLSAGQLAHWQTAYQRRLEGEPVAYIVGHKAFYGLRLKVSAAVLDPRDDTETLVDWALQLIPKDRVVHVLDLGTGSGAVALAIGSQRPLAQITATDASPDALATTAENAAALQLFVRLVQADAKNPDWFSALGGEEFDIIVANPPYIAEGDPHLAALKHEPAMALTSGKDGLDAIRSIIAHSSQHLRSNGHLLLEHGHDQAQRVRQIFSAHAFNGVTTRQDLAQADRCTGARVS